MKKKMMVLACMSTVLMYGMENPHTLSFVIGSTIITLSKCRVHEVPAVDLMVVGKVQQRMLKVRPTAYGDSHEVGLMEYDDTKNFNHMVYLKDGDVDSDSDDDTYKPYDMYKLGEDKLWEHAHTEYVKSRVISVLEPRIMFRHYRDKQKGEFVNGAHYFAHRKFLDGDHDDEYVELDGDEAITQALKDLGFGYKQALNGAWENIGDKEHKSVALSALGIDVGIPREKAAPVVVETIVEFVQNNPEKFALIHLFLKRQSDFDRYRDLLEKACG